MGALRRISAAGLGGAGTWRWRRARSASPAVHAWSTSPSPELRCGPADCSRVSMGEGSSVHSHRKSLGGLCLRSCSLLAVRAVDAITPPRSGPGRAERWRQRSEASLDQLEPDSAMRVVGLCRVAGLRRVRATPARTIATPIASGRVIGSLRTSAPRMTATTGSR